MAVRRGALLSTVAVLFLGITLLLAGAWQQASAQAGRVAIVFATGGLGDQSFNDSAYDGIQRAARELGIEFDYAEPTAIAEYERLLTLFAQSRRYDLIISVGFDQADAVAAVADRFPNQKFAIVDTVVEKPNVAAYVYREAERGFLVGAIAGLMTKRHGDPKINPDNHVVGIVAGMDIPLINANIAGFMAGARLVNPDADVRYSYVGHWADPARGKELGLALIAQGADIIWGAAGLSGLGAIQAAQESNRYAIGADSDQGHLAPEHILTNGMKLVNNTVFLAVESVVNGTFQPGVHVLGVKENVLGYSPSLVPDDVRAVVDALAQRIAAGELVPPETIPDVEAWLAANR